MYYFINNYKINTKDKELHKKLYVIGGYLINDLFSA